MIRYEIFVNCNLVATGWQYYSTHLHTNSTHNNTINLGKCRPCPVFASYTLAFVLQLRKKDGKTSVTLCMLKIYIVSVTCTDYTSWTARP